MSSDASCPSDAYFGDPVQPIVGDRTFHDLAAYIAGGCTAVSVVLCFGLCFMHLCTYRDRTEQRQIARIILTPAIISIFDFLSIVVVDASGFLKAAGEYYDAVALVALYLLFVNYATPAQQRGGPKSLLGWMPNIYSQFSYNSSKMNLSAYYRSWFLVFQIIPVRFITMVAMMAVDGTVCKQLEHKNRAGTIVNAISTVSTVMCFLAVIRFMRSVKPALAGRRPIMKTIALKGVVAFAVLLNLIFSILKTTNTLKTSDHLDLKDLYISLPDLMVCCVGLIFSVLVVIPYNITPYTASAQPGVQKHSFFYALFDVLNFTDILMGVFLIPSAFSNMSSSNPEASGSVNYAKNEYAPQSGYVQQTEMPPAMPPHAYGREDYEMGRR